MGKFTFNCLFKCLVCFLQLLYSKTVFGEETNEFDGLPGEQHEFKVQVAAGREDCFYQTIREGAKLEVLYKVLRGGDRTVNVFLKGPNETVIDSIVNKKYWDFERTAVETGDYSICIDNTLSRLSSKLVYVYMMTSIMSEWKTYANELDAVHVTVSNFTTSINSVEMSINEVLKHQATTRMDWTWDLYLIFRNRKYVQYWAILHCALFIVTSVFQVYFVRRLFRYIKATPIEKPRP